MLGPARLIALLGLLAATSAAAQDKILPSEFTVLVNHAINGDPGPSDRTVSPGEKRRSFTNPHIGRVISEDLPEIERFFKGEVHFLHLEPEPARDAYWEFRDRDDDLGRVAWQRLMVIRINAFQMADELIAHDIPQYNERFGPRPDDRYGISFPVQRTASVLAAKGEVDTALDLIVEHVRQHDQFDAPYTAYELPGQFLEVATENGREKEFRDLSSWIVTGLTRSIDARLADPRIEGPKPSGLPGEVFSSLFADRKFDNYDWTAAFIRLRDKIESGL